MSSHLHICLLHFKLSIHALLSQFVHIELENHSNDYVESIFWFFKWLHLDYVTSSKSFKFSFKVTRHFLNRGKSCEVKRQEYRPCT